MAGPGPFRYLSYIVYGKRLTSIRAREAVGQALRLRQTQPDFVLTVWLGTKRHPHASG